MDHRVWTIALFAALMLAGCTSEPVDDPPVVVTDPDDFSQFGNDTNGAGRPHIHDYWGNQERLTVLEFDGDVGFLLHGSGSGYRAEVFRPDTIIPLGASQVEITVSWDDQPPDGYRAGDNPLELWIKTAADASAEPFTQLENGQTVTYESTNDQNDIPHQRISAWQFVLAVPDAVEQPTGGHRGSYDFPVQMTVEAVRGLEIPPYPGHADLWGNETMLEILHVDDHDYEWGTAPGVAGCSPCNDAPDEFRPYDRAIVPYDADHIEVVVEDAHDTPDGLQLIYHGADAWDWSDAERVSEEGGTQTYVIPVDGNGDSPYALQSLWRFGFRHETRDDQPVSVSAGDVAMQVTVHRDPA